MSDPTDKQNNATPKPREFDCDKLMKVLHEFQSQVATLEDGGIGDDSPNAKASLSQMLDAAKELTKSIAAIAYLEACRRDPNYLANAADRLYIYRSHLRILNRLIGNARKATDKAIEDVNELRFEEEKPEAN